MKGNTNCSQNKFKTEDFIAYSHFIVYSHYFLLALQFVYVLENFSLTAVVQGHMGVC